MKDKGETCRKRQNVQTGPSERREGRRKLGLGRRSLRLPQPGQQRVPEDAHRQEESHLGQE